MQILDPCATRQLLQIAWNIDSKQGINVVNLFSDEAYALLDNIDDIEYIMSDGESEIGHVNGEEIETEEEKDTDEIVL